MIGTSIIYLLTDVICICVSRVRDKGDDLSRVLQNYGEQENLNKSLRSAVCETADTIAAVQDYRYEISSQECCISAITALDNL